MFSVKNNSTQNQNEFSRFSSLNEIKWWAEFCEFLLKSWPTWEVSTLLCLRCRSHEVLLFSRILKAPSWWMDLPVVNELDKWCTESPVTSFPECVQIYVCEASHIITRTTITTTVKSSGGHLVDRCRRLFNLCVHARFKMTASSQQVYICRELPSVHAPVWVFFFFPSVRFGICWSVTCLPLPGSL